MWRGYKLYDLLIIPCALMPYGILYMNHLTR